MMIRWLVTSAAVLLLAAPLSRASEAMAPIDEVFEPAGTFDPGQYGKVAVVQWNPTSPTPVGVSQEAADAFKARLRSELEGYIREAASKGAEWVITPEFSLVGYPDFPELPPEEDEYRNPDDLRPYVEPIPGPSTEYFGNLARELKINLNIALAEVDGKTGKFYNAVVALGPKGEILAKYRKINLYQTETNFLEPGSDIATFDTPFGKAGIIVCADVYASNPMQKYRAAGVKVLALSTSWAQMNTGMSTFQRGAKGVGAFLLAANQTYFPDSGVINPDGTLQSHIRQTRGIAYGYLPRVKSLRWWKWPR